jgi:thioredoxin 1
MRWHKLVAVGAVAIALAACTMPEERSMSAISSSDLPHTTDTTFERDVIDSDQPVLVEFYAEWCGPCRHMEPILADLARMYHGKIKVVRVDVDKNPLVAQRYRIQAIPRMMLFKNGDLVDDVLGATSRERLSYSVERTL